MRILFVGDIVGEAGRDILKKFLPALKAKHKLDVIVANVENMAGGFGITPQTVQEMAQAGVHIQSGGNHSFDKKEGLSCIEDDDYVLRPANYPKGTPGRGWTLYSLDADRKFAVLNVMGRVFMDALDCPFQTVDTLIPEIQKRTRNILVDVHAEASSEKMAMGWHLDGKVSAVVGTHTHVQTADERILPKGTAFITDVGMTGPYDSVIGVKKEIIVERFITKRGRKFEVANGEPWLCAVVIEIDEATGQATKIERIRIEQGRPETHP